MMMMMMIMMIIMMVIVAITIIIVMITAIPVTYFQSSRSYGFVSILTTKKSNKTKA